MPTTSKNSETVVLYSGYRSDRATTTVSYFFCGVQDLLHILRGSERYRQPAGNIVIKWPALLTTAGRA
jgi:hypothetical protein